MHSVPIFSGAGQQVPSEQKYFYSAPHYHKYIQTRKKTVMQDQITRLLPGVPSVESPFFSHIFSDPSIDDEIRRIAHDLNQNGFAVLDFPDDDFDRIADSIKAALNENFPWQDWLDFGFEKNNGLRAINAWKFDENVKRLATNARIIEILTTLFGRQAWPFQTLNFPVGTQQHVHTDSVHFSSVPERFMCGVWTALEDISADAGPLVYYPGSHKWPIFTNEHIGACSAEEKSELNQNAYEPLWRALIDVHEIKPVTFTPKKGQSLIWLANLLHGGNRQTNKQKTRWSQVTHYYFEGCAYHSPMHSDPFYGAISFRNLSNIITGEQVKHQYCGHDIDEAFIAAAKDRVGSKKVPLPADFDPEQYLLANRDLREANVDPVYHYRHYGISEGRPLTPLPEGFDGEQYLNANPDVRTANIDAAAHYRNYGKNEGRPLRPAE